MFKKIIVNKFGGGILAKKYIPLIEKRLRQQIKTGYAPIAVVSALPGITDELLLFSKKRELAGQSIKLFISRLFKKHLKIMAEIGVSDKWFNQAKIEWEEILRGLEKDLNIVRHSGLTNILEDKIAAYGEKMSVIFLAGLLNDKGLSAEKFFAEEIPVITDDNFKNAGIKYQISEKNIRKKLPVLNELPVIAGFTGKTAKGQTTVLGRGGTDTTACFLAAALRADKVILWKDVGGVLSADPKIVPEAKTIPYISYQEAEESGKVIQEKAIQYVKMFNTPLEIVSLTKPENKTKVGAATRKKSGAKIVSFKRNLTLFIINEEKIKMNDLLSMACQIFAKHKVEIILISNARYILQIVADNENGLVDKVFKELKNKVAAIKAFKVNMVFLVGSFNVNDVNDFNNLLIKHKTGLEISAFLYENCARIEAIIKSDKIENIIRVLYKKFIK